MALTQVNRGTTPNDNSADTLYVAFGKVNSNATSLDTTITTSSDSIFNGVKVGRSNGNIATNTVLGLNVLSNNTTGNSNTAIGVNVLIDNSDGFSNTGIGSYAMERNTTGDGNTAVGSGALYNAVSLNNNTAVGLDALNSNTLYSNCTGIGYGANVTASNQVVIGNTSVTTTILRGAITADKDATFNEVKIGRGAGNIATNTAVGVNSLVNNQGGNNSSAFGYGALNSNITGINNSAFGANALTLTTVSDNTGFGTSVLFSNTTGNSNTAIGSTALYNNVGGDNNNAFGNSALINNVSGIQNVSIGSGSLYNSIIRNYNTAVGHQSLSSNTLYSNCVGLGSNAQVNGENQVQLGDAATTPYAYQALSLRSDLRDKTEVRDTVLGLDFINELRPVDYKWDMREDYKTEMPIKPELPAQELPIKELPIQEPLPLQGELSYQDYMEIVQQCNADYQEILEQYNLDYQELLDQSNADYQEIVDQNNADFKIVMDAWLESVKLDNITHDGTHTRTRYHHGLIAQEVQDVIEASGVDFGGFQDHSVSGGQDVLSIGYDELIAPMIKAIQELTARINVLENN